MRFFAELKKAYASIEAMSAVPEGGGVWIYDNFYLIKRSYSDICASSKAIRRFLKEKDSDRLLSLLDGFLFKYDFRSPFDKLLAYLRGQRYVYSSQFLSLVPVLLRALALRELGRICGNLRLGLPYSKSHLSNALDLLRTRNEEDSSALFSLWKPGRLLETAEEGYIYYDEPTVARYRGALYDYARQLVQSGKAGLFDFISHLRQLLENGDAPTLGTAQAAQGIWVAGRLRLPPQPCAGVIHLRAGAGLAAAVALRVLRAAHVVDAASAADACRLRLYGL